ncbi:thioredoxin domain-containing protein [Salinarimonas sp.]|uniref:thioredoxin domain-containing protein n=1 Tax=Salinarimonas sp. TaxID=2766526 RepID=UPI0032D916FD
MLTRRSILAALCAGVPAVLAGLPLAPRALAQQGPEAAPRRVPGELAAEALALPAAVPLGAEAADVVFLEFFDYNCPVCRATAAHLGPLLAMENVGVRLMNYPILSDASREAAAIALGVLAHAGPETYRTFHATLFESRGLVDGGRALRVAEETGLDPDAIGRAAALPGVAPALDHMVRLGRVMGFDATPTLLVGPWAYEGWVSLDRKQRIVADLRG